MKSPALLLVIPLLVSLLVIVIPVTADHNVTFINTCNQDVFVNLQGGPKGVCSGVIDNNTHVLKKCAACSMCPASENTTAQLCNTSASTGTLEPLCCPGIIQEQLYCWDGTQCEGGHTPHECCPPYAQTVTAGQSYNCPNAGETTGCGNSTMTQTQINALSGYNNATLHLAHVVCNGSLIAGGGFELPPTIGNQTFSFQTGWQGAFYPRTGCTFDAGGKGGCKTGNCTDVHGNGVLQCGGAGSAAPVTKGEMNLDDAIDWYDVSWVDGFNIAMVIQPGQFDTAYQATDPDHHCSSAGCDVGLADFASPAVTDFDLLKYPSTTDFAGILSDCNYYSDLPRGSSFDSDLWNGYCCPISEGYVNDSTIPGQCHDVPTGKTCRTCAGQRNDLYPFTQPGALPNSAKLFYSTCTKAYAYTYNDTDALMMCQGAASTNTSYTVTLSCPVTLPRPTLTYGGLTLTSGGISSDSSNSPSENANNPAGSPGSTVVSSPATNSGGTLSFSFNQQPSETSPVGVNRVQISTNQQTDSFAVTAQPVSPGAALQIPGQPVAGYLQITPVAVDHNAISFGTITFGVNGAWLAGNNILPENIVMERYNNNQWNALPTTFVRQSGNTYYFDAVTPGFSYFAITIRPSGTNGNVTAPVAATGGSTSPDTTGTIPLTTSLPGTPPVPGIAPTAVTTAVPPVPPLPAAGLPATAIAAVVIITGGLAVFLVRRWWIRRQNPALFLDMD